MILLVLVAIVGIVGLVWLVVTFNRLASVRVHLRSSWADVDVELKRRYDLVPNLVETVKGHAAHERTLFEEVIALRDVARANHDRPDRQSGDERAMESGLGQLLAVAEAFPELKSSERFLDLQEELTNTEDRIAAGRRFYNANVRELNQLCRTFPSSLVAGIFGFETQGFFEAEAGSRSAAIVDREP